MENTGDEIGHFGFRKEDLGRKNILYVQAKKKSIWWLNNCHRLGCVNATECSFALVLGARF